MNSAQPKLLRNLRSKFILMNMLLAALVLSVAFGVVCYLDYMNRLTTVYDELDVVLAEVATPDVPQIDSIRPLTTVDTTGAVTVAPNGMGAGAADGRTSEGDDADTTSKNGSRVEFTAPMIGKSPEDKNTVVLVAVYSVAPNGIYTVVGDYTTATISESVILHANEIVLDSDDVRGYIPEFNLYYERIVSPSNPRDTIVAYADGTSVSGWTNLAITLVLVGIAGLVALFLINIFFSRWALKPVKTSIEQQHQFTADASHELKTPLTVILANMAILKGQPDATVESQMQWIDSTHTEAERMQLLVNDMLELSKPDGQKAALPMEDVDLSDLVEGEALQFESVAFELGVDLESEIEEGLIVEGNHDRLARMVATLIDNACKYASSEDGKEEAVAGDEAHEAADAVAGDKAAAEAVEAEDEAVAAVVAATDGGSDDADATDADDTDDGSDAAVAAVAAVAADADVAAADEGVDDEAAGDSDADDADAVDSDTDDADDLDDGPLDEDAACESPCVTITLTRKGASGMRSDEAVLTVHNDGPSIPAEDIPYIFNRFYRADKARTSSKGGYGLGLAIGQEIAHEHDGNIAVESSPRRGTTFTVTLPLVD